MIMINTETLEAIRDAIEILQKNLNINRIDGKGWIVYLVGNIIRIDIKNKE